MEGLDSESFVDMAGPSFLLAAVLAVSAGGPGLDRSADVVVDSTPVPSAWFRVGEVRIVRRGDTDVVQTILRTRYLSRVAARIAEKDRSNWPPGSSGRADSDRYVEALERAADDVLRADRREVPSLLIEFARGPGVSAVVLAEPHVVRDADGLHVSDARTIAVLRASEAYVERDMILIVSDSFDVSESDASARLSLRVSPSRDRH